LPSPRRSRTRFQRLVRTHPLIDKQIINVDLIPHALREDQRRLPPSLTDRFALQVTPPAPFKVELPEKLLTLGSLSACRVSDCADAAKEF